MGWEQMPKIPLAVARIFEVKARPRIDPIIIHVADPTSASQVRIFPEIAQRLIKQFWPGPLTLVVDKTRLVPPIVTAGLDTVAIRVPSHPAALALISAAGGGIAAPSANLFGYVSPTTAQHVADQLGDRIDYILDGGACTIGLESTILSLAGNVPCLLRAGGVSIEELESVIGKFDVAIDSTEKPLAPGQLKRHYATRTRLVIFRAGERGIDARRAGWVAESFPAGGSGSVRGRGGSFRIREPEGSSGKPFWSPAAA